MSTVNRAPIAWVDNNSEWVDNRDGVTFIYPFPFCYLKNVHVDGNIQNLPHLHINDWSPFHCILCYDIVKYLIIM